MKFIPALSRTREGITRQRQHADDRAAPRNGRSPQKTALAQLTIAGLLGLSGLIAGGAAPAAASSASGRPAAHVVKHPPRRPPTAPGVAMGNAVPAKPHRPHPAIFRPHVWTVTLTANPSLLWPTQYSTLTATANMDVGPTPYYIRIYDDTAHSYVASCGTGTTCSVAVTQQTAGTHGYTAWIADDSSSAPPGSLHATSGETNVTWQSNCVRLAASPTTLPVGSTTTLTTTTCADVGPSPFYTEIFDTSGTLLARCGFGTTCTATVSQSVATTRAYTAYIADYSTAYPPAPPIQATSTTSYVTWSNTGWQITLSVSGSSFFGGTLTATTNMDVGPTPYFIEIFNDAGGQVTRCAIGTTCSARATPGFSGASYVACVSLADSTLPPAGIQACSNVVTVFRRFIL